MPEPQELFARMDDYVSFLADLGDVAAEVLSAAMAEGKWSVLETVAHITAWDVSFLGTAVRVFEEGGRPALADDVDYQAFNERAAAVGRTQRKEQLLSEAVQARVQLLDHLRRLPAEAFLVTHQGETTTDLVEFLERNFVSHDRHHVERIRTYLMAALP